MKPIIGVAAALLVASAATAGAQERLGSASPEPSLRPGWVFTPSLGFSETHDDNVTLFGTGDTAREDTSDLIASINPHGDLSYYGRHTKFSAGYGGSFLNYRTFSLFDRWDQSGALDFKRQQNARLELFAHGDAAMMPSTEALEFNGIPFSHTGATMVNVRGGGGYKLSDRDSLTATVQYQRVDFDRSDTLAAYLQGGTNNGVTTTFRHRLNARTSVGADYSYGHSRVRNDVDESTTHTTQGAIDYELTDSWRVSAGGGIVMLAATPLTPRVTAPAFRGSADRAVRGRRFHVGYGQGIMPSFGLGGTVKAEELSVGYFTPLFHSRRFFTDLSAVYRNSTPVLDTDAVLRLRSLRTSSSIGWFATPWVSLQGFYTHDSQTTLLAGGRINRNRFGFRIVTTKPMRIE